MNNIIVLDYKDAVTYTALKNDVEKTRFLKIFKKHKLNVWLRKTRISAMIDS